MHGCGTVFTTTLFVKLYTHTQFQFTMLHKTLVLFHCIIPALSLVGWQRFSQVSQGYYQKHYNLWFPVCFWATNSNKFAFDFSISPVKLVMDQVLNSYQDSGNLYDLGRYHSVKHARKSNYLLKIIELFIYVTSLMHMTCIP